MRFLSHTCNILLFPMISIDREYINMFKRSSAKSKVHPKQISPKKDLVYSHSSATYTQSSLKDDKDNVIDFLSE